MTIDDFSLALSVRLDKVFTEEQKTFFQDFTVPTLAFASPGTGKTMSAVTGLLTAELFHGIPGQNIYALSFTRAATGELATRHKRACEKLSQSIGASRVHQTIQFGTLSSFCKTIVEENYEAVGLTSRPTTKNVPMQSAVTIIRDLCDKWGIPVQQNKLRTIVYAIRSLNASLIFDQHNVEESYDFKTTGIDYESFTRLRAAMFVYSINTDTMPVNDIFLYALVVFMNKPEVSTALKKKIRIMLVDEAQDLSLLQLKLISYMTDCPVLIGDMKQQIYGFNGACSEIVSEFFKLYPTARRLELNQSFRCRDEIADFATKIILPNEMGGESFKGVGTGGTVEVLSQIDYTEVAEQIKMDYESNRSNFTKDIMFLFRNNVSMIPVVEALYKAKVPFRSDKYISVSKLPVISDLMQIVNLCRNPFDLNNLTALKYLLPEFRYYASASSMPVYKILSKQGGSLYDLNYNYKDFIAPKVFNTLIDVSDALRKNALLSDVLNSIYPIYKSSWLDDNEWKLEQSADYYIKIALPAIRGKTYSQFISDENEKDSINTEFSAQNRGVRCYTMHSSKGLEADVVYIVDADDGIIPNANQIKKREKVNCILSIAKDIRNERSLCYVACTRARSELYIIASSEVSPMFLGINEFRNYDAVYKCSKSAVHDEISAFGDFVRSASDGV